MKRFGWYYSSCAVLKRNGSSNSGLEPYGPISANSRIGWWSLKH